MTRHTLTQAMLAAAPGEDVRGVIITCKGGERAHTEQDDSCVRYRYPLGVRATVW